MVFIAQSGNLFGRRGTSRKDVMIATKEIPSIEKGKEINQQKEDVMPYEINFMFDVNENKEFWMKIISSQTAMKSFVWSIRVFPTETLAFCRNTKKEDTEREIILSWEKNDPRRTENSKKSRLAYLLEEKKRNGNDLTEDEKKIIDAYQKTLTRYSTSVQPYKTKHQPSISNPNTKKDTKSVSSSSRYYKETEGRKIPDINFNKNSLPTSESHVAFFVKNFINYSKEIQTEKKEQVRKVQKGMRAIGSASEINENNVLIEKKNRILDDMEIYEANIKIQEEKVVKNTKQMIVALGKDKKKLSTERNVLEKNNNLLGDLRQEFIRNAENRSTLELEISEYLHKINESADDLGSNKEEGKEEKKISFVDTGKKMKEVNSNITWYKNENDKSKRLFEFINKSRTAGVEWNYQEKVYLKFLDVTFTLIDNMIKYSNQNSFKKNNTAKKEVDVLFYDIMKSVEGSLIGTKTMSFNRGKRIFTEIEERINKLRKLII